jgi:hypothetical protein
LSSETYRKHGRTVRLERIGGDRALIAVLESGEAESHDEVFSCRSFPAHLPLPEIDETTVIRAESAIVSLMDDRLWLERLVITSGIAVHERQTAAGERVWSDASFRIHASIVNRQGGLRMTWDETNPDDKSLAELARAISALASNPGHPDANPARIQLSGPVAAALWPVLLLALAGRPAGDRKERSELTLAQSSGGGYDIDGNGEAIAVTTLFDGAHVADRWPNVFRPTYRRRPQSMPMNLRASLEREEEVATDSLALAILEPPAVEGSDVAVLLLVVDGDRRGFPMRLAMTPSEWFSAVVGLGGVDRWYPYGAGSFGRVTTIDVAGRGGRAQFV